MRWHIIAGEYPPQPGGVSDYTYQLARGLSTGTGDEVHIFAPHCLGEVEPISGVTVHRIPGGYGLRWLRALNRALQPSGTDEAILVQYVPHGYGWKAMNLAFCAWMYRQRRRRLFVMFHEVAYPFRSGQPLKHNFLAAVQRFMAWVALRSAERSFTSIPGYRDLLNRLVPQARVGLLRLHSNVPFNARWYGPERAGDCIKTVGIFSNFWPDICRVLDPVVATILAGSGVRLRLIGPAEHFVESLRAKCPELAGKISTTGFVRAVDVGPHLQSCDALLQIYPDGAAGARGTLTAALASGVPVVTNSGPFIEPLFESSGAVVIAQSEPASICRALYELLSDEAVARRVGNAARRLYEEHFDLAVAVAKLRGAASGDQEQSTADAPGLSGAWNNEKVEVAD